MSEEKYKSIKDWTTGKMFSDYESQVIENFNYHKVKDIGCLPRELYEQNLLPVGVFRKIVNAQKKTFFKLVEHNVKVMLKHFNERLESAYKSTELIRLKIESLTSKIENAPVHLLERVYSGDWSRIGIDYSTYMVINDARFIEGDGMLLLSNQIQVFDRAGEKKIIDLKGKHNNSYNYLFVLTIRVRYLDELKKLLKDEYSDKSDLRKKLTKNEIFVKASELKENGRKVNYMFEEIKKWLLDDLKLTKDEVKKRFGIGLNDPNSFNRLVNKNTSFRNLRTDKND